MSAWVATGGGTYRRLVQRARRDRRCGDCGRVLPAGRPYAELRAAPWFEFNSSRRFYGLAVCGLTTEACEGRT